MRSKVSSFHNKATLKCCRSLISIIVHLPFSFEHYKITLSYPSFFQTCVSLKLYCKTKKSACSPLLWLHQHFKQYVTRFAWDYFFPWLLGDHAHLLCLYLTSHCFPVSLLLHLTPVVLTVITPSHFTVRVLSFGECVSFPFSTSTLSNRGRPVSATGYFHLDVSLALHT